MMQEWKQFSLSTFLWKFPFDLVNNTPCLLNFWIIAFIVEIYTFNFLATFEKLLIAQFTSLILHFS